MPDPATSAQARNDSGVRLAELMAALSVATDLGMGQPLESALCTCVVALRLGQALELDEHMLRDVYYLALLRYIGCNAETDVMSALFGDELALRRDFATVDPGRPGDVLGLALRYMREVAAGEPPLRTATLVARGLLSLPRLMSESFAGHCEVAQRLAQRLGLSQSLIACLGQIYERWDGKGLPRKLKGAQVAPALQIVTLAQDAVVWARIGGPDAAVATVARRAGAAYEPCIAARFCQAAAGILGGLSDEPTWDSVVALEPGGAAPHGGNHEAGSLALPDRGTVLVTGATGTVGREVVRELQALGVPVRAASTSPERARAALGPDVSVVAFAFGEPETYPGAFDGISGLSVASIAT